MSRIDSSILKKLGPLAAVTALVAVLAVTRHYSFFPNTMSDGFFAQVQYVKGLISTGQWSSIILDPLTIVHLVRFVLVSPFLAAQNLLGPAASATMICVLMWPLLMEFPSSDRNGFRSTLNITARLSILFLPLLVSGRTVMVFAGMGYLVAGVLAKPNSGLKILVGALLGSLSSASLFLSLALLVFVRKNSERPPAFYRWKNFVALLILIMIVPSMWAKVSGFSEGAPGYELSMEEMGGEETIAIAEGDIHGPVAALQRVLVRSTVVQSYMSEDYARLTFYLIMWGAAVIYLIRSIVGRNWNSMAVILLVLSTGVLVEGLSVWPLLFPVIWVFTGDVVKKRRTGVVEWRI